MGNCFAMSTGEGGGLRDLFVGRAGQRAGAGEGADGIDVESDHRGRGDSRAERGGDEGGEFDALCAGRADGFEGEGREVEFHAAQEAFDIGGGARNDAVFAGGIDAEFDGGDAAFERFHHVIGGNDRIGVRDNLSNIPGQVGVVDGTSTTDERREAGGAGGVGGPVGRAVERLHGHAMLGLRGDAGQGRAIQRLFGKSQPLRLGGGRKFGRKGKLVCHESLSTGHGPQGIRLAPRQDCLALRDREFATFWRHCRRPKRRYGQPVFHLGDFHGDSGFSGEPAIHSGDRVAALHHIDAGPCARAVQGRRDRVFPVAERAAAGAAGRVADAAERRAGGGAAGQSGGEDRALCGEPDRPQVEQPDRGRPGAVREAQGADRDHLAGRAARSERGDPFLWRHRAARHHQRGVRAQGAGERAPMA